MNKIQIDEAKGWEVLDALTLINQADDDRDFLSGAECYAVDKAVTILREALADIGNPISGQPALPDAANRKLTQQLEQEWVELRKLREAEQPAPMIRGDIRDGLVDDEPAQQEPVAWVYSEGLEALKNGKPWTAYGTKQEANNIALYLHPTPECEPYAWVTFTPYGDEDDVWYENPEGQLLEGWTYKPLYDTAPPRREWVGLTEKEMNDITCGMVKSWVMDQLARTIEAKLKEKNK